MNQTSCLYFFNQKLSMFAYWITFHLVRKKKDLIVFGRNLKIPIIVRSKAVSWPASAKQTTTGVKPLSFFSALLFLISNPSPSKYFNKKLNIFTKQSHLVATEIFFVQFLTKVTHALTSQREDAKVLYKKVLQITL